MKLRIILIIAHCALASCSNDPETTDKGSGQDDEPISGTTCEPNLIEDLSECEPASTDYRPRENGSADDSWAACITDDNAYHQIDPSVSTVARVQAYETMADLLWNNSDGPGSQDFVDARLAFEQEQGLGSRVARRYDVHYDAPPGEVSCSDEGAAADFPDYCVGPATLQGIIIDALIDGSAGKNRVVNAEKIHAALLWFFYVSAVKESTTCFSAAKDCDSAWAYYSGGTERDNPIGLGAEIAALSPETHGRAFDGILAVRCWRDLDGGAEGQPVDTGLQALAIEQLDAALLVGMARLIENYFLQVECATEDYADAAFASLKVLVPLFDRAMREQDEAAADAVSGQLASFDFIDATQAGSILQGIFDCP